MTVSSGTSLLIITPNTFQNLLQRDVTTLSHDMFLRHHLVIFE